MTVDEYRAALEGLSDTDFRRLCETWGGAKENVEATVQLFAHAEDSARWERIAIYHLESIGVAGLGACRVRGRSRSAPEQECERNLVGN